MATIEQQKSKAKPKRRPVFRSRFNIRLAVLLLILAAGVAGSVHFVHRHQVDRNADVLLVRANKAREQGKVDAAIQNYSQYLAFRPDDTDALAEVGILLEEDALAAQTLVRAYLAFEAVVRRDPERDDIRRRLVDLCMRLGRFRDALVHIEVLQSGDDEDHELLFLTGRCHEGQGKWSQATALYQDAIAKAPAELDPYRRLVQIVLRNSDELRLSEIDPLLRDHVTAIEVVDQLMETAVEVGQPRFRAFLTRAQYRRGRGQFALAQEDLDQALQLASDEVDVLLEAATLNLGRAESAAATGSVEEAESLLDAAAETAQRGLPKDPRFFVTLCQVELARNQSERAIAILRQGLQKLANVAADETVTKTTEDILMRGFVQRQLLFMLVDILIAEAQVSAELAGSEQFAEAEKLTARLELSGQSAQMAKFLRGRMQALQQEWYRAAEMFESARAPGLGVDLSQRVDLEISRCYQQLGNPDARLLALRRSITADRLWIRGRLEFASALVAAGRLDDAVNEYEDLITIRVVPVTLARLRTLQQVTSPPDRRNWNRVEQLLQVAYQALPDSPDVPILEAEVRTQQKDFDAAQKVLERALERFPKAPAIWAAQVLVDLKREGVEPAERLKAARETLAEAKLIVGEVVELRLAEAEVVTHSDRDEALRELARLRKEAANLDREQRRLMLVGLTRFYDAIGAGNESRSVWQALAKEQPNDIEAWIRLARSAAERNDEQVRATAVGEIRRIEGADGPNANYEEAVHLIEAARGDDATAKELNRLSDARRMLGQAAKKRPSWAAVPRALGVLQELAGNPDEAVAQFRRAINLGDRSRTIVQKVAWYYFQRKQFDQADAELQNLASERPDAVTGDLARLAWRVAWGRQQYDRALGLAGEVAAGSEDYRDQIILAEVRFAHGLRGSEVEGPLNLALETAPHQPEPWLAKVGYLTRVGQSNEARQTIDEAAGKLAEENRTLTLAQCYELVSDLENAEKQYVKFVEAKPEDFRRLIMAADFFSRTGESTKAEPYLKRLTDQESEAPESAVAWARRRQAMVIASRGSYNDTADALAMLARNRGSDSEHSVANMRTEAAILASRPNRRDRLKAIELFEQVGNETALAPEESFTLAQLYEGTGDWIRSRERLLRLVSEDPNHAPRLAYWVRALVRHDELDEAQLWMNQLNERHPDTFLTVTTHTRLLGALDRSAEAVPLLQDYLDARRGATESLTDLLEQNKAEEIVRILESYLRDRLDRSAIKVFVQVGELLKSGQRDAAVQVLGTYVRARKLEEASQASAMHVAAALLEETGELQAAEELFRKFSEQSDHPAAVFIQAKYYARNGRTDEALEICERAPESKDPGLVASACASVIGHGQPTGEQFRRAEQLITSARGRAPDSPACLVAAADLLLARRRFFEAEQFYRQALAVNEENVIALNNLAWCLATQGEQLSTALEMIDRAVKIAGRQPALLDTRAIVLLSFGRSREALTDLQEAFADSDSAIGKLHLADAHLQVGETEVARQIFAAAQAGLKLASLHPLERERYDRVAAAVKDLQPAAVGLR